MRPLRISFIAAVLLNAGLLWYFHDRFWYPTDDGLYAHVAERLLHGAVLNRDVQDIHPGYIHVLHATAFRLFGVDLVSLRYPLIAAALVEACFVYAILHRRSAMLAFFGSLGATALGVIQWVSPTANWYCGALAILLAWWMMRTPASHPTRLAGAGMVLGVAILLRHLSGVWIAMAVISLALLERSSDSRDRPPLLARAVVLIMLTALLAYLLLSPETEPGGVLLMAVWPAAVLLWMLGKMRTSNRDTAAVLAQLAIGMAIPALPLVSYHLWHRSLIHWVRDIVGAAAGETQMDFFGHGWYGVLSLAGLHQAMVSFDPVKIVNGCYWAVLPALSAMNGAYVILRLRRGADTNELTLPLIAAFYALVALYLEGPLYLYYTTGISLAAVLWIAGRLSRRVHFAAAAATAAVSLVAVIFHAGQSARRTPVQILAGERITATSTLRQADLDRCHLRLDSADRDLYARLVVVIQANSAADERILALPNDAELYFLARRPNALWFYNSALGLHTAAAIERAITELRDRPPRLVMFRPNDKYNTTATARIMTLVRAGYVQIDTIAGLEIYRR